MCLDTFLICIHTFFQICGFYGFMLWICCLISIVASAFCRLPPAPAVALLLATKISFPCSMKYCNFWFYFVTFLFENFYFVSNQKERDERSHNSCIFSISGNKIELGNRVEVKIVSVEIERKRIGLDFLKVI